MPNPNSKKRHNRTKEGAGTPLNSPGFEDEGDIYALLGESEEEDDARLQEAMKKEKTPEEELDLGDVLEDMTNFSGENSDQQQKTSSENVFEGLSDAEKVAKAIELAGQKRQAGEKRETKKKRKERRTVPHHGKSSGRGKIQNHNSSRPEHKIKTREQKARRKRNVMLAVIIAAGIAAFFVIWHSVTHHVYHSCAVIRQEKRSDNVSSYEYTDGYILRYSTEGASLFDQKFQSIWNESFSMERPKADICGQQAVIYDQRGTSVEIYNRNGKVSEFSTSSPILKAVISNSDTVAMLLQNGNSTEFSYRERDGSVIAEGQSSMSGTGYPTDLAISPNGEEMILSFLRLRNGNVSTTLNFYNFGKAGEGRKNNLIGSDSLPGTIVPEVCFLSDRKMAAVRDDGFSIYEGTSSISEVSNVKFSRDIVSAFHDSSHLAFCFSADSDEAEYELQTYSDNGRLISSTELQESYQKAEVSGDQIIFYGSSNIHICNMNGFMRFSGQVKAGNIGDVLKVGRNRYLIVTDETMEIVKLR